MNDIEIRSDIEALKVNHRNLDEKIDTLAASINNLTIRIERQHRESFERLRTPWGTLISAGGFLMAIVAAIGASWVKPLEQGQYYNRELIERVEKELAEEIVSQKEASRQRIDEVYRFAEKANDRIQSVDMALIKRETP